MTYWDKKENYSLSSQDLTKLVGGVPIIKYPDLQYYDVNKFLKLFSNPKSGFILFFETENATTGHWETCFMNSKNIHFFDSYGLKPDEAQDYLSKNTDIKLQENKPYLTNLFSQCMDMGYNCFYSVYKYQEMLGNVSTCGRWSATRLFNHTKTDSQFLDYMTSLKKRWGAKTFDETVVELTFQYLGK
jgi:hypothetical protein